MALHSAESIEWSTHYLGEFLFPWSKFRSSLNMLKMKDLMYFYCFCYRMPLCAPHTMVSVDGGATSFYREGFILTLYFEDGSFGLGEVCFWFNIFST